jgi:hypothetical protein
MSPKAKIFLLRVSSPERCQPNERSHFAGTSPATHISDRRISMAVAHARRLTGTLKA